MSRQPTALVLRLLSVVLTAGAALFVVLLLLRFGMRALGVRPDVALPGLVYTLTAPLVQPFYRLFPLPQPYGDRFDVAVVEPAALVAAGIIALAVTGIYVLWLLLVEGQLATRK